MKLPRRRYCNCHRLDDDSRTRQSFVGGLHPLCGGEEGNAGEAVCVRATGPCYVVSIGWPVSLAVERKPSKYDWKKNVITSLTNRKSESDIKCENILSKTEWLADVCYCTQLFHRLCCKMIRKKDWHTQIYRAVSVVEPRRLLLSTGKNKRL